MNNITLKLSIAPWGRQLYKTGVFEFHTGKTVLVGRNGSGKSTVLQLIVDYCKDNNIPCFRYDNYNDGGDSAMQHYLINGQVDFFAGSAFHSEGEQIYNNICAKMRDIGAFIRRHQDAQQVFILFDALDSGFDADGFIQIDRICELVQNDNPKMAIYILLTANNYGLVEGSSCYDVKRNEYIEFKSYEDYKSFILGQYEEERKEEEKDKGCKPSHG